MPMPAILTEFGCGHSIRTGTQVILYIVLVTCVCGLQAVNLYYYEVKKPKLADSYTTFIILDLLVGIYASLCGLYGVYSAKRIWLKQFLIYLACQFVFAAFTCWQYYVFMSPPEQPTFPRRTRYLILTTILAVICLTGVLSYALAVVFSHYKDLDNNRNDRQFLLPDEERGISPIPDGDQFPSNFSDVTSVSTRTYLTTVPNPNERARYANAFAPTPIPEEPEPQKTAELVSNGSQVIDFS